MYVAPGLFSRRRRWSPKARTPVAPVHTVPGERRVLTGQVGEAEWLSCRLGRRSCSGQASPGKPCGGRLDTQPAPGSRPEDGSGDLIISCRALARVALRLPQLQSGRWQLAAAALRPVLGRYRKLRFRGFTLISPNHTYATVVWDITPAITTACKLRSDRPGPGGGHPAGTAKSSVVQV